MKVRVVISYDFSDKQRAQLAAYDGIDVGLIPDPDYAVQGSDGVYRATRKALSRHLLINGIPQNGNGEWTEMMSFD